MCPEAGQRRRCPQVGAAAGGRHRRQAEPLQAWGGWGTASSHPSPSPADPNTGSTVGVLAVLTLITGASTVPTHGATLSATIRAGNAGPVRHEQCAPGTAGDCRASLGSAAWLQLQEPRGAGQLMTSGQVRRRGGLETSVTSREGDVPQKPSRSQERDVRAPEGSGPQVSLPFPSERARCAEWVVSGSLLPTRPCSHRLPSKAHSEWRAPECPGQLARPGPPDARRWQGRTSPARVVHTPRGSAWVVPRGLGGERSSVWPLGLASPVPSSVALTQKTQQPALWPLNALYFLMRFIRPSRGKGSSESNLPTPFPSA